MDRFTDYMVKDVKTGECYRADHLLKGTSYLPVPVPPSLHPLSPSRSPSPAPSPSLSLPLLQSANIDMH